MLHLLSSSCPSVKFKSFNNDSAVTEGYIIISHVWQDIEQPYEEVLRLEGEATVADDPRISVKVRECHRLARAYGFGWFWVDAPCIDNRNSTELSEAIRSMYSWYASASICFAHLPDVPSHDRIHDPGSAFRRSIYFKRGWTLQELIAPRRVIFLSSDWTVLGEKDELADLLEEITGIDQDVLTFRRRVADVSVARRLSWASQRETRYVEDQAYCLMGLFGIHMNIKYGEGDNAFLRLQQKILKKICDHTLFAWGAVTDMLPPFDQTETYIKDRSHSATSLFAPSPAAFSSSRSMRPVDIETFMVSMETLAGDATGHAQVCGSICDPSTTYLIDTPLATATLFSRSLRPEMPPPCPVPRTHSGCRPPRLPRPGKFVHRARLTPTRSSKRNLRHSEPRRIRGAAVSTPVRLWRYL